MKFDVIVGNPPFGMRTDYIHLMIMNTALKFCTDKWVFIMPSKPRTKQLSSEWYNMFKNAVCNKIEVVGKDVFKNTDMDNTAIYYCNRNDDPKNYCKKLDVDKVIYNMIDSDAHRLFIDKMSRMKQLSIYFIFGSKTYYEDNLNSFIVKSNINKFYLNVNRVSTEPGKGETQWFSNILKEVGVLTKDEEIEFCKEHTKRKNIIECPSKEYGENLKNLMLNELVLKYSLWLVQDNQAIYQAEFKYVPDLDYTNIHTDEELLSICGFTPEEISQVMDYLENFDFSKNRNDVIRANLI